MEKKNFSYGEFSLGTLVGLTLGIGLGLLLAPQSGVATRDQIATRASDVRDSTADLLYRAKRSLELATVKMERTLGREEKGMRKKLEEIRVELEEYAKKA